MRKRFLILFLLVSAVVYGQTPAGYIKANMRFKWTAGIFDSALHVPQYNGTPSDIRNGAWVGDGAVAVDTVNNLFYFRSSGAWHSTSSGSGWLLTGNAGTTSSNFIGTTDNQPLSFRVNNRWAGRIYTNGSVFIGDSSGVNNSALNNAGFGRYSLYGNTTGGDNTGSGVYSLYSNTNGWDNTGSGAYSLYSNTSGEGNTGSGAYSLYSNIDGELNTGSGLNSLYNNTTGVGNTGSGVYSLYSNTSGEGNTGSGAYSLRNNTTGSNNTGMGYAAGYNAKQKVDAKNQILIGANTYGTRDSITVLGASFIKETIVRGKLIDSTLSAGAGTKAVRWNSSTGEFTYADTSEVTTPTWQQTLTAGSTLTQDNTITSTGYDFSFNGQNIQFNATDGVNLTGTIAGTTSTISVDGSQLTLRNSRSGATSGLDIRADSIMIEPHLGLLKIDTLAAASSQNQLIGWTSTSGANRGKVGAVTIGTGLSLSSGTLNSVWTASGNDVYNNNSGNVGIGNIAPDSLLTVELGIRGKRGARFDGLPTFSDTTNYKPVVINSSGTLYKATYWPGGGGGTPAGSNKQVQYNNSGSFGGAAGVEIGNTNERLTVTSQATSEAALTVKQVGQYVGINIKPSDASNPHSPLLSFSQTVNSVSAKMGLDGGVFRIEGCLNPYGFQNQQEVAFGPFYSGVANFRVHTDVDVPASPDDWTIRVRTPKTAAVGQVIDWGAAGQTGDLLQFRNNSNTVMARFDSIGKLGVNTVPVSYVDANGSLGAAITTTSSNITLDATHHTVIITSGTPTITLPAAASSNARRIYVVVNQTGSAVTISSYQNFSGSGTTTVAANSSIQIQSDGSNWYRIL